LATRSYINLVRQAQSREYLVTLLFFWLRTPELALQRIAERVKSGGHDIPTATARRRYVSGITNLFNLYVPEVDYWMLYDNSSSPRIAVARGGRQLETTVYDQETYKTIKSYV